VLFPGLPGEGEGRGCGSRAGEENGRRGGEPHEITGET